MTNSIKKSMFSPAYLDFSTFDAVDEEFFTIDYKFPDTDGRAVLFVKVFDDKFKPLIQIYTDNEDEYEYRADYEFTNEELSILQTALICFFYLRESCNKEAAISELNAQMEALRG